jgi:hypothetical protein
MSLSTSFPYLTSNPLNFNSQAFFTDLSQDALGGDGSYDPWIRNNEVDNNDLGVNPLDFMDVGDGRLSLGIVLSAVYAEFIPRIQLYEEVAAAGGCQIINEYICDTDGNPIVKTTTNCSSNVNLNVIQPQEIITFIQNLSAVTLQNHVNNFVAFLQREVIKGWTISLVDMSLIKVMYIKLTKSGQSNRYYRYYYDQMNYIASQLGVTPYTRLGTTPGESEADLPTIIEMMGAPLPDYTKL